MAVRVDFIGLDASDPTVALAPRQGTLWFWRARFTNTDMAGVVAHMELRTRYGAEDAALDLTEGNGRLTWVSRGSINTDAILAVQVNADDMSEVAAKSYKYDLELSPGGDPALTYAAFFGDVAVQPEVTT